MKSKYGNKKAMADGIKFDSKKERDQYLFLKSEEKAGYISDLELQPEFEIAPPVTLDGKKKRARKYRADFRYVKNSKMVVEDVKGYRTAMYRLKRHLVKAIHGVEVKEI